MMRNSGVKSVALGGRPSNSKIQAIGGVKGAQSLSFAPLLEFSQFFLGPATASSSTTSAQKSVLQKISDLPLRRSLDNGINFSDQILIQNLQDGTPAQFIREDADCRLFYTPAMIQNVTAMWQAAAASAFSGKACVAGGINQQNSTVKATAKTNSKQIAAMTQAAADARTYLQEVRRKAVIEPAQRMSGWEETNGRAIPKMYMN